MLEVITGPMFCGKTSELIRRVRRLEHAVPSVNIYVCKPGIDTRSHMVETHFGDRIHALMLESFDPLACEDGDWLFIEEFQFAGNEWIDIVLEMTKRDVNVVLVGLSLDSRGMPFGPMAVVMPFADRITCLTAVCKKCGADATKTQRKEAEGDTVMVGGADAYEARCNRCWEPR